MIFACGHPSCGKRFVHEVAVRQHIVAAHDEWARTCSECYHRTPAPNGLVTIGPDGSIGDGSPASPMHDDAQMVLFSPSTSPAMEHHGFAMSITALGGGSAAVHAISACALLFSPDLQASAVTDMACTHQLEMDQMTRMSARFSLNDPLPCV